MKAILMSIQPKWVTMIEYRKKTIEVRKTRPKLEPPFKCYIYCTFPQKPVYDIWINRGTENRFLGNGKVIGEFVCDNIEKFVVGSLACDDVEKQACLSYKEICDYFYGENYDNTVRVGYSWHISELKIYDKPKELSEFWAYNAELHERFANEEGFCCYDGTNEYGELLDECAIFNTDITRCYRCWEEWSGWCHRVKRPPQSWCYVEELEE